MKITIVTVGKKPAPEIASLIAEYEKRLRSRITFEWKYITQRHSELAKVIDHESDQILSCIDNCSAVILLDETGVQLNNSQLVQKLESLEQLHGPGITFVIGGAYGVNARVKERANIVWSLSRLVFPHQLVRLILIEQLYRTAMLQAGHPYHHT